MVPPDGERAKRLPTLSWTSVLDEASDADSTAAASPPTSQDATSQDATSQDATSDLDPSAQAPTPVASPPPPPAVAPVTAPVGFPSPAVPLVAPEVPAAQTADQISNEQPVVAPVVLTPMTLSLGGDTADAAEAEVPPHPTTAPETVEEPASENPSSIVFAPMTIAPPPRDPSIEMPAIRTFAPAAIVPAIVEPEPEVVAPAPDPEPSDELPEIREATPVEPVPLDVAAPEAQISPRLPSVATPDQRHVPAPTAVTIPSTVEPPSARRPQRRTRRGAKLVVVLVLLLGLVAAGVVFGRPYLFPSGWDATTEPYAQAVETARNVAFVEPLSIVAEPAADVDLRAVAHVIGPDDSVPVWRALGLATGEPTAADAAGRLGAWWTAVYSTDDGQVYVDDAVDGAEVDAMITQAMVAAALDQDYAWSSDQTGRSLDGAAQTSAHVLRESRAVQAASAFDTAAPAVDLSAADGLASVAAYRALAPQLFAEFAHPSAEGSALADLGDDGPGPLGGDLLDIAQEASLLDGDLSASSPQAMDRAFWFLVLAGFVDTRTAYGASEALVESALTTAERGGTTCAYATFSGGGVDETALVRGALEQWAAAAPAELGASFSVLDDGTLQLASCDPGPEFQTPVRFNVARELVAWRVTELAALETIAATDPADPDADFAFAWPFVAGSSTVDDLVALPSTTAPADYAAAARQAVQAVFNSGG